MLSYAGRVGCSSHSRQCCSHSCHRKTQCLCSYTGSWKENTDLVLSFHITKVFYLSLQISLIIYLSFQISLIIYLLFQISLIIYLLFQISLIIYLSFQITLIIYLFFFSDITDHLLVISDNTDLSVVSVFLAVLSVCFCMGHGSFCHGALIKLDPIYIVCNIFSLNISSI